MRKVARKEYSIELRPDFRLSSRYSRTKSGVLSHRSDCLLIAHVAPLCNSRFNPEKAYGEGRFHLIGNRDFRHYLQLNVGSTLLSLALPRLTLCLRLLKLAQACSWLLQACFMVAQACSGTARACSCLLRTIYD
jgi:hypothetical protein